MRVSRSEWDHRDQLLSTLRYLPFNLIQLLSFINGRAENHELQQKLRDKAESSENYHQVMKTLHF